MNEFRFQKIKEDIQNLICDYLSDKVGDVELGEFITRAEADEDPVTLVNEIVEELDYRKQFENIFFKKEEA